VEIEQARLADKNEIEVLKTKLEQALLVVEPDYLPDSEVLAFSRVYTP
jgi:hypothetical protein